MSNVILADETNDCHDVAIPLNNKKFVDLILNFLGKKEKLIYQEDLNFVLKRNDVEQFYYLLNSKLEKEQHVYIDHFLVTIEYDDKTRREISGIDSLNRFLETRDVIATSITLTWNLIFKLPKAETIENQSIELTFFANKDDKSNIGEVVLTINHTNQAWAVEVLNLLRDKIKNVSEIELPSVVRAKTIRTFISIDNFIVTAMVSLFLLFGAMFTGFNYPSDDNRAYYSIAEHISGQPDAVDAMIAVIAIDRMDGKSIKKVAEQLLVNQELKNKLEILSGERTRNHKSFFNRIRGGVAFFLCIFAYRIYLGRYIKFFGGASYILITDKSEKVQKRDLDDKNKLQFYTIRLVVISALCGSFGNLIYELIGPLFK